MGGGRRSGSRGGGRRRRRRTRAVVAGPALGELGQPPDGRVALLRAEPQGRAVEPSELLGELRGEEEAEAELCLARGGLAFLFVCGKEREKKRSGSRGRER